MHPMKMTNPATAPQTSAPVSFEALLPCLYDELRRIAHRHLRNERSGHTLTPTALVHEVYLKLAPQKDASYNDQQHFAVMASQAMRRILVNHARDRNRQKRGGGAQRITLKPYHARSHLTIEVIALDNALRELEQFDPTKRRLVELRYFGGFTAEETAKALEISRATFYREWAVARSWLCSRLGDDEAS